MKSKHVLILHTSIFAFFVVGSLSTPVLSVYYKNFFASNYYLIGAAVLMVTVVLSWKIFGGCPFTVWENRLRKIELKEPYAQSCLPYYSVKWFNLNWPKTFFDATLVGLLVIQIIVGISARF